TNVWGCRKSNMKRAPSAVMFSACWDGSPKSATRLKTITAFMKLSAWTICALPKLKRRLKFTKKTKTKKTKKDPGNSGVLFQADNLGSKIIGFNHKRTVIGGIFGNFQNTEKQNVCSHQSRYGTD